MEFLRFLPSMLGQAAPELDVGNFVVESFHNAVKGYGPPIQAYAVWLFWTLATISLVWTGVTLLFRRAEMMEFVSELTRFIISLGFFFWLLTSATRFTVDIVDGLTAAAGKASGTGTDGSNAIFLQAKDVSWNAVQQISMWEPRLAFLWALIALCSLVLGCYVLVVYSVAYCSAAMLSYAGIFVLGFGGSRWTSDIAITYYKAVIAAGLKLFALSLLASAAVRIVEETVKTYNHELAGAMTCLAVLVIIALLIDRIPDQIAGLVSGSAIRSPGSAFGSVSTAGGVVAMGLTAAPKAAQATASTVASAIRRVSSSLGKSRS